ncbi:hypothetical protein MW290_18900 [Aquincola tertiaricarbonis]|uniref:Uncharacterized protein n=1 Tax=Aquincola tertiaricarbonis TaxID=391953 RepID=A0ABY4SIP2_AQUTE|nr:hypothetical protein [Aquincola tertiaricarbonis]URI11039.1 hypothetical protein MW290_18900 [Aquincola tertiaricarbonis]
MSAINDGGPAFPAAGMTGRGLSLRDYFIAHAPVEPQPWFRPTMPPAPDIPALDQAPQEVREELEHSDYDEWLDPADMSPAARAWHEQREAAKKTFAVWSQEKNKQWLVQWPSAWADEMLKAREGGAA